KEQNNRKPEVIRYGVPIIPRHIPVTRSNEHFQVDMTKVWCGTDGWGYLFAVIDAFDKRRSSAGPSPGVAPRIFFYKPSTKP
ncbi:hypothetical protein, partial [Desulforudis sp. DRI-14]|uniref:hypothetical protein n=1 Tax=Desulforudis sp. DRI-14 TaxID=3459793 RepID=UPI0040415FDD